MVSGQRARWLRFLLALQLDIISHVNLTFSFTTNQISNKQCLQREGSKKKRFLIYLFHWYLNYIITVPAVHHPIKLQYLHFELILGDFASGLLEVCFGTIFRNPLETNHRKKCLKKHFCAGTWLNTNESISLL